MDWNSILLGIALGLVAYRLDKIGAAYQTLLLARAKRLLVDVEYFPPRKEKEGV